MRFWAVLVLASAYVGYLSATFRGIYRVLLDIRGELRRMR